MSASDQPQLWLPPKPQFEPEDDVSYQIVVGVDGSQNAERALRFAFDEAELREGEVTALFAWQFPLIGVPKAFDQDELEGEAKELLLKEIAGAQPAGTVKVNAVVAQGDTSASLLHACQRVNADLLVLGARGREGFTGLLLGSVGQECAVHSPCSVVIVKPPVD
jgi:nucleotide-binding universal stress UspA family protein